MSKEPSRMDGASGQGPSRPAVERGGSGRSRITVTNAEITRAFLKKGWEIRYRGGNSICSTPSDMEMIVADAPGTGGAPRSPGSRPRYSIAAWPVADGPGGEPRPPVFDLYDAERDVEVRVDDVPSPEQAARLLERRGNGGSATGYPDEV